MSDVLPLCPANESLASIRDLFSPSPETEVLMLEALRENLAFQWERHPFVRWLGERAGFSPADLRAPEDVLHIPPLFVGTLKVHGFLSVPPEKVMLTLTSSGTSGQKTRLLLDAGSLQRLERISCAVFSGLGYCSEAPSHYLLFAYDRAEAQEVGTSWSTEQKMACAPVKSMHWLIRCDESPGDFQFDVHTTADLLIELASDGPIRFLGFPAFMYRAVEEAVRRKPSLRVDPRSFVLAGGGWKNHAGASLKHEEFARFLEQSIGIPVENVRDVFGMAEHGIPYGACRFGHHHVPIVSRLVVRHPRTMAPLPYGEEGLLQLLTPYNMAQPNCSILSTDVARLGSDCPCGLPGDYLASVRRGGTHKHKGCAIAAQEILDRAAKREGGRS